MSDDLPAVSRTIRERRGPVTVIVNLTLPPWPSPPAIDPPAAPLPLPAPAPLPVDPPAPSSPPPVEESNLSWIRRVLNHLFLDLTDNAHVFYKQARFWLFTILFAAPDLYNLAVSEHLITGGHVPAMVEKFFNLIAFLGAAGVIVKTRKALTPAERQSRKMARLVKKKK